MSIVSAFEALISKLDGNAREELAELQADVKAKAAQVEPVLENLKDKTVTVITDAIEQAYPGVRAALADLISEAEQELRDLLA